MENVIKLDADNYGSFYGALAQPYAYKPELRKRLDDILMAAKQSQNRYFVLEGMTVRAAQSTMDGASNYMDAGRVLVEVLIPPTTPESIIREAYKTQPQLKLATTESRDVIGSWSESLGRYVVVASLSLTGEWLTMPYELLINGEPPVRKWIAVH